MAGTPATSSRVARVRALRPDLPAVPVYRRGVHGVFDRQPLGQGREPGESSPSLRPARADARVAGRPLQRAVQPRPGQRGGLGRNALRQCSRPDRPGIHVCRVDNREHPMARPVDLGGGAARRLLGGAAIHPRAGIRCRRSPCRSHVDRLHRSTPRAGDFTRTSTIPRGCSPSSPRSPRRCWDVSQASC